MKKLFVMMVLCVSGTAYAECEVQIVNLSSAWTTGPYLMKDPAAFAGKDLRQLKKSIREMGCKASVVSSLESISWSSGTLAVVIEAPKIICDEHGRFGPISADFKIYKNSNEVCNSGSVGFADGTPLSEPIFDSIHVCL
jgi:hypothetical protein